MRDTRYNIYCDESCHLPNDGKNLLVLGALLCPENKSRSISRDIKDIKKKQHINPLAELKWSKISKSKAKVYCDLIDYYFDNSDLSFRSIIATGKRDLNHEAFNQNYDSWYFKMYFQLIQTLLEPSNSYKILIDRKDTCSQNKIRQLHDILCRSKYDFDKKIISNVKTVISEETPCLQIVDILIGALSYIHRELSGNEGKLAVIERIKQRSNKTLIKTTLIKEHKLNLFVWSPQDVNE